MIRAIAILLAAWSLLAASAPAQYPYAVVLACIDSRTPPELVFYQGLGDIFVPRIAGNYANADILGSMEFATKVAGAKLVLVVWSISVRARSLSITKPQQGEPLQPFCGALISTSTPVASISTQMVPEAIQSSTNSPPCS